MTLVLGPIHWAAARSAPRAAILPARTAMACAVGAEGFMVTILPLRRTRSAGWAWRQAAKAAKRTETRMESRIQKISRKSAGRGFSQRREDRKVKMANQDSGDRWPFRANGQELPHPDPPQGRNTR